MKRIACYILLFAYLSSVTELHELFKAANLIGHYMQHCEQDSELSMIDFLALHYGNESAHAHSAEHNEQLPFKSHHASVALSHFMAIIPAITTAAVSTWMNDSMGPVSFYRPLVVSSPVSAIWQPPKLG